MAHAGSGDLQAFEHFVERNAEVEFVHLQWVDVCGILRSRAVTVERALELARARQGFKAGAFAMLGIANASLLPRSFYFGIPSYLWPAWSSACLISSTTVSVLCGGSDESDVKSDCNYAVPFRHCMRRVLQDMINRAEQNHRLSFSVGFELEFYLLDSHDQEALFSDERQNQVSWNRWSAASSMQGNALRCLEDCVRSLQAANISVAQFHAESGRSQFEIATDYTEPMQAVDRLMQSQQIIRSRAMEYGYRATFLPHPFPGMGPSGQHAHVSLKRHGEPVNSISDSIVESFTAGILDMLPALVAIGMPSERSYTRIQSGDAGEWVSWGTENRDCPVRKISPTHFEFRAIDGLANMYWVLAAYIAAGLIGIEERRSLRIKDCRDFIGRMDSSERVAHGIDVRMPHTWTEALEALKRHSDVLGSVLGREILEFYLLAKEGEMAELRKLPAVEQERFYLEHF